MTPKPWKSSVSPELWRIFQYNLSRRTYKPLYVSFNIGIGANFLLAYLAKEDTEKLEEHRDLIEFFVFNNSLNQKPKKVLLHPIG